MDSAPFRSISPTRTLRCGQGHYDDDYDPFWFEGGEPITASLAWARERQRLRGVGNGVSEEKEEGQDAFWKRKDRCVFSLCEYVSG